MTSWLLALRERRGGSGTRSGLRASFGDFGTKGPEPPLFPEFGSLVLFVSVTATP
nr:hypothetical protein [Rhizobium lemnae]